MFQTERQGLGKESAVAAVIGGNLLFGTGLIFHAFLYNFYLEGLHLSTEVMGHAAAALTAGGLVTLLPAGLLTDRAGPKASVTIAAAVLAAGLALGAAATTPLAAYAAAAVAGAGSGIWRVATPPILMGLTEPSTRARVRVERRAARRLGWTGDGDRGPHARVARTSLGPHAPARDALGPHPRRRPKCRERGAVPHGPCHGRGAGPRTCPRPR